MTNDNLRVVIAGAGPGGLEAALALRSLAGDRVDIELVAPGPRYTYRASSVAEPFGGDHAATVDLGQLADEQGFGFTLSRVWAVAAKDHLIATDERSITYDVLVLALGAYQVPAVPGALTFGGPRDVRGLRVALEQHCREADARVAYVANSTDWPLPAYELALMTSGWGEERGIPVEVCLVTAESEPLEAFGPGDSARTRQLLRDRGIALHTETVAESHDAGRLLLSGAGSLPADLAVALPAHIGPSVPGVPHDNGGFVDVDDAGRVVGLEDVYAVGDMTARPLKQGGLATQQADVAAAHIASAAGATCATPSYVPALRALLLTGDQPIALGDHRSGDEPTHKLSSRHLGPYLDSHEDLVTAPAR